MLANKKRVGASWYGIRISKRGTYMLKYVRDVKRMKLAGYRVSRAFCFMQGMVSLRVAHPLLARQGQEIPGIVFVRYERTRSLFTRNIQQTWRRSKKIRAITDRFPIFRFFFFFENRVLYT